MVDHVEFEFEKEQYDKLKKYLTNPRKKYSRTAYDIKLKNKYIIIEIKDCECYVLIDDAISFYKFMEENDIDCNFEDYSYETLINNNRLDVYEYFVKYEQHYYLHFCGAIRLMNMDAVKILLEYANDIYDTYNILVKYYSKCSIDIIELFLDKIKDNPDMDYWDYRKLLCALIKEDDPEILKLCVNKDIDVRNFSGDLFDVVFSEGLINVAEYLVNIGCSIETDHYGYIKYWADRDRYDMVDFLFKEYGNDLEQEWLDQMLLNSEKYSEDIIQLFIDNGADINKYGPKLYKKLRQNKNYELAKYIKKMLDD